LPISVDNQILPIGYNQEKPGRTILSLTQTDPWQAGRKGVESCGQNGVLSDAGLSATSSSIQDIQMFRARNAAKADHADVVHCRHTMNNKTQNIGYFYIQPNYQRYCTYC
jgi:hypothetical protein